MKHVRMFFFLSDVESGRRGGSGGFTLTVVE